MATAYVPGDQKVKFFKNVDYRYCPLTTWIKHCFNKVNAFEPVPFSADRQQQFYLSHQLSISFYSI